MQRGPLLRRRDPAPECDGKSRRLRSGEDGQTEVQTEQRARPQLRLLSPLSSLLLETKRRFSLNVFCLFCVCRIFCDSLFSLSREGLKLIGASWGDSDIRGGSRSDVSWQISEVSLSDDVKVLSYVIISAGVDIFKLTAPVISSPCGRVSGSEGLWFFHRCDFELQSFLMLNYRSTLFLYELPAWTLHVIRKPERVSVRSSPFI